MIDWKKYVDRIFIVHYAGHKEREAALFGEMKRVGIWNSGIMQIHENIQSPFLERLMTCIQYDKDHLNKGSFSASFGHYFVMKISEMKEYDRIMIFENDVCFLKNIDTISRVLDNIPNDCDVGLLTHFQTPCTEPCKIKKYFSEMEKSRSENTIFIPYGGDSAELGSAGCYVLSKTAVTSLCGLYEHSMELPDIIFREQAYDRRYTKNKFHRQVLERLKKYYSRIPICIQRVYQNSITMDLQKPLLWKKIEETGIRINETVGIFRKNYNI